MTMDIRQANTHLSAGASRGIAKMDGTGKLSNKIALITGGTTGIGAAAARCFQVGPPGAIEKKFTVSQQAYGEVSYEQRPLYLEK
jgi:hypothetical protein